MRLDPRTGRHYPEPTFVLWRNQILKTLLLPQYYKSRYKRITTPSILIVRYWPGDLRRRDVPALLDGLFHCFEKAGIIEDDSLIRDVHWIEENLDRKNPRAILELKPKSEYTQATWKRRPENSDTLHGG